MIIFDSILDVLIECFRSGHKLLICGNGGSAADAQHIAAEFVVKCRLVRKPLPAIALTDVAIISAIGNDFGFEQVFSRQVIAYGKPGDVLLALSTSGKSQNVIAAIVRARELQMHVVGFTGSEDMARLCHQAMVFEGTTGEIQQAYMAAVHAICEAVEQWAPAA